MKRKILLFVTILISANLLLVTSINPGTYASHVKQLGGLADYSLDTPLTLQIEFLGFDDGLINETEIESMLSLQFWKGQTDIGESLMSFDLLFNYASEDDYANLKSYIETYGTNGTGVGYELNTTQLDQDLASGERNNILIPQDGLLMDAELTEDYIYNNLYTENTENPGYTLFFLNFSSFDSEDHSLEHWYKTTSTDFDTNLTIDTWFSGYSDIPYVPTLGWGGDNRFCFLDLSARTWYYDWIETAWGDLGMGNFIYYDYRDLDELAQLVDLYSDTGNSILSEYIGDYIQSYLFNVFSGYYYRNSIVESYSLQVKVFNNLTNIGYTYEDINWVISETRIKEQLVNDFPWIDWVIDIEYVNIADYPILDDWISDNIQYGPSGPYVEIMNEFFYLLEDQLNDHFDYTAADTVLPCYFFLNDEVGFEYWGIRFAGLGGMGWEILVADQHVIFESGNPDFPRHGMSATMIHELGHSLGFPHPHSSYYGWGSSFFEEVMNYFSAGEAGFSVFYRDGLGRAHSNYFYSYAGLQLDFAFEDFVDAGSPNELVSYINDAGVLHQQAATNYSDMEYNACVQKSKATLDAIDLFYYYLDNPAETPTPTPTVTETTNAMNIIMIAITISLSLLIMRKMRK